MNIFMAFLNMWIILLYILYVQRYICKDPLCNINFIFEKTKTEPTAELNNH